MQETGTLFCGTTAMEDMMNEAASAADLAVRKKMALKLLNNGRMTLEEIAEVAELSVEEV